MSRYPLKYIRIGPSSGESSVVQKKDMEDQTCHPHSDDIDETEIIRSTSDLPPAHDHYTFQIKNFSLLLAMTDEKCHSGQFEVGGYQWRLVLYPNGKKKSNGNGHISLYLEITAIDDLSPGWEVNANIRFFVFDQIRDKYLSIQDANGRVVRRFQKLKTEWGFAQLLPHETLNDSSNGYLIDDICVFGVEFFVIKGPFKGECLSMINQPQSDYFTWKIDKFMASKVEVDVSEPFTVGGRKWTLCLHSKGGGKELDTWFGLYLMLCNPETLSLNRKVYTKFKLRIRDQINSIHLENTGEKWFPNTTFLAGCPNFLSMRELQDTSKGYLVGDTLFFECKIDVISVVTDFSSK